MVVVSPIPGGPLPESESLSISRYAPLLVARRSSIFTVSMPLDSFMLVLRCLVDDLRRVLRKGCETRLTFFLFLRKHPGTKVWYILSRNGRVVPKTTNASKLAVTPGMLKYIIKMARSALRSGVVATASRLLFFWAVIWKMLFVTSKILAVMIPGQHTHTQKRGNAPL